MGTSATRLRATLPPSNTVPGLGGTGPQGGSQSSELLETAIEKKANEVAESESSKGYRVLNEIAREFRKDFAEVDRNDFPGDY
jgi:hypothetical protein